MKLHPVILEHLSTHAGFPLCFFGPLLAMCIFVALACGNALPTVL